MTVGAVLDHPVSSVDAFEIEPAVIEASRFFEPDAFDPPKAKKGLPVPAWLE